MTTQSPEPVDWSTRSIPLGPPAAPVPPPPAYRGADPYRPPITGPIPYQPAYQPPTRKRSLGALGWLLIVAAVLLIGGGATLGALVYLGKTPVAVPGVSRFDVHGTLTIVGDCSGWGYSDIRGGTEVSLADGSGKTVAVSSLGSAGSCQWSFLLLNVPAGGGYYALTIGRRGTLHYTETQLRQGVNVELGG